MRKLRFYLILLFFCVVATAGCLSSRITKCYDFSGAQLIVDQKDLAISAALLGASSPGEKESGLNVTLRSSPYTLFFVLTSNTGYYREAIISNILIRNEKSEIILPKSPAPGVGQFSESPGGSLTKVSFKHLELPYETLFLTADVEIMTRANSVIKQPIQFSFEPTYSEEKSND
jgi:hypothetical protein